MTRYFRRKHVQAFCDTKRARLLNIEEQLLSAEGISKIFARVANLKIKILCYYYR